MTVIVYKQFFDSVPRDFREAAVIDGANEFQLLFRIFLPMNWGVTTALAIITFIGAWNSFLWPFLAIKTEDMMTVTVGITAVQDAFGVYYARLLAGAVLAGLPVAARLSSLPAPGDAGDHAVRRHQGLGRSPQTSARGALQLAATHFQCSVFHASLPGRGSIGVRSRGGANICRIGNRAEQAAVLPRGQSGEAFE